MAVHLVNRPPTFEGRLYQPGSEEVTAEALTAWINSYGSEATVDVTADEQGFSITVYTDLDGTSTATGGPGDWLVLGRNGYYPEVFTPAELDIWFQVVA